MLRVLKIIVYFYCSIQERLTTEQPFIVSDPAVYSLENLVSIRNGEMKSRLQFLVEISWRHIHECEVNITILDTFLGVDAV